MFSPQIPPTITVDPTDSSQGLDAEHNVAHSLTRGLGHSRQVFPIDPAPSDFAWLDVSSAGVVNDVTGGFMFLPSSFGGSSITGMAPGASTVTRSRGASFDTTLSSIQSHDDIAGIRQDGVPGHSSFKPESLADMVSSKSMAELEAVGGLGGLACGLYTDLTAGLGLCEPGSDSSAAGSSHSSDSLSTLEARRAAFGSNQIPDKKIRSIFDLMLFALSDRVLILLSVVAAISLSVGLYQSFGQPHAPGQPRVEWVDGFTIMAAVMIVVVTGAANDYQKERQFARLTKKKALRAVVAIRSGKPIEVSVFDVLAGDVLQLNPGDLVPVDGILISGHAIYCDESSISGESDQVKKTPAAKALADLRKGRNANGLDPFIISGSKIVEGTGIYLVTAVGVNSTHGRLQMSLSERPEATPLQEKLSGVADKIAISGVAVATVMFLVLIIKLAVNIPGTDQTPVELLQTFLRIFSVSITIVVLAVPEGLPLAVTLALSIAVTRMLKDNNLVRILAACETMGNATTVCCDKTGTLTMNKMRVTRGILGISGHFSDAENRRLSSSSPQAACNSDDESLLDGLSTLPVDDQAMSLANLCSILSPDLRDIMVKSIAVNSTSFEQDEDGSLVFIGSKTEASLLAFAREWLGMGPLQEERANAQAVEVYPFDSTRKFMATVTRLPDQKYRIYVKGAPEVLLKYCTNVMSDAASSLDQDVPVTEERRDLLLNTIQEYASQSMRVLGVAYKDTPHWPPLGYAPDGVPTEQILADTTLLAVLGIEDPLRPCVADAVAKCQGAGVVVRMVTGDNVQTARAVATQCGILADDGLVIEGPAFRQLSDTEMDQILPRLQVLARSSPDDKNLLVRRLKELGETVAVTGDGTNDGPALRAADVGFSMGISGTEIAKEASSIVLMDDDFSSIVKAIQWGRTVNDAVRKFLNFQLTVNITAVAVTFVSAVISDKEESILTPVQLLWVNLIMDTFAALALATDSPSPTVLERPPHRKSTPLISTTGWKLIIGQAVYQLVVILILNLRGAQVLGLQPEEMVTLETLVFNVLVWMQLFNLYNNRRLDNGLNVFEGIMDNYYFIAINIAIAVGQFLIVHFGGSALSATQLSAKEWAISLVLGFLCIPLGVLLRLIPDEAIKHLFDFRRYTMWGTRPRERVNAHTDGTAWSTALRRVRCELRTIRQPRSSRLQRLRSEISDLAILGMRGGWARHSAEVDETSPLLQPQASDRVLSRQSSVCRPSVIMAGLVAGGVAGWPDNNAR
ncbi:plasma membrane calcium [Purpureocillium takamizusanense]|uniref:Calcium-transporting ATPase n=1 Tax=Purpureocillium takamizusanense TaxID=2060973 RepID=A0A9Q8QAT3_9HYPO|nr:plasma membrane calcium [Purpureocillium takamizusanense]UNI15526.1 plasma membrane calcium [Purpureocillium takamizusanense]